MVPIPKISTPLTVNDIRPISMTPLWSKLLESYIASYTLVETRQNWKSNQHGGRKGSSTDHVLIQMWDTILTELDTATDKPRAAVLCGIDFSKSFSRCSYQLILESYVGLGASQWIIDMHAAFLMDRSMQVKVGNTLSGSLPVTGGAVQGSVLGVMDHNAVMEKVDESFLSESHKYVDDLTTTETIAHSAEGYKYQAELGGVVTDIYHAPMSELNLHSLTEHCMATGLKVNENKTQLIAISSNKRPAKAWMQAGRESVQSSEELKLLGFVFSEKPDVSAQISNLIKRATKRMFVLRYYSSFMPGKDLKTLYCSLVRSVLEYSSVTYHSMLTKKQENDLELVQKKCLRCIYGYKKTYNDLLKESGLPPLKTRRETAVAKFIKKTYNNPVYSYWFKPNSNMTSQRCPKLIQEKFAQTDRLYNSPMFAMRHLLTNSPHEPRHESNFMDLAHLFDDL